MGGAVAKATAISAKAISRIPIQTAIFNSSEPFFSESFMVIIDPLKAGL